MYYKTTESLLAFIKKSPTAFQATAEMEKKFAENGYQLLSEQEYWKLQPGGKYIVTRNHSALIAFSIPKKECRKFHIIASHSDSPAFKIKENPEMRVENAYIKLNVEGYGGMLMAPWFDRPLSVAGRVVVRRDGSLKEELVNIDRDLVMIPSLAIHMNREANKGVSYNPQKDLLPLLGCGDSRPELLNIIAEELKVSTGIFLHMICSSIIGRRVRSGVQTENLFRHQGWMTCSVRLLRWKECLPESTRRALRCTVFWITKKSEAEQSRGQLLLS